MIGDLSLLVTAGNDNILTVFKIDYQEDGLFLERDSTFLKESNVKCVQLQYYSKLKLLIILSGDNKLEVFKVNTDKPDSILKKL